MGKNHIRVYREMGCEVTAIADTDRNIDLGVIDDRDMVHYYDYTDMLADGEVDAVSVCVPTELHYGVAMECMSHNVPVLVEKPLAASVGQGRGLVEFSKETGVLLAVGHVESYNPAVVALRDSIEKLGYVYKVTARRCGPTATRIKDVGVALDLAIHDIDVILWLLQREVESVLAFDENWIGGKGEDGIVAILRFEGGVLGLLEVDRVTPRKVRELTVLGERGMFVVDYLTQDLWFYENGENRKGEAWAEISRLRGASEGRVIKYVVEKKEPLRLELEAFVTAVREGHKKDVVIAKEGLRALEIAVQLC
jgi:predicted dehydrogenase